MKRRDFMVVDGEQRYAYSTGEIIEALQGAGVLTDAALSITRTFEGNLRNRATPEITMEELLERLERLIRDRVNPEIATRFRKQTPPFVPLLVVKGGNVEPISVRKLARSLEKLGPHFKAANGVARQVEQTLRTQGSQQVPWNVLAHNVALALE